MSAHILFHAGAQTSDVPVTPAAPQETVPVALDDRLRALESNLISWALKVSNGNKSRAAELLQIKRSTLGDRIARCGLTRTHSASEPQPAAESTSSATV
jgi:DNA-binding NtrC family response regulator